MLLIVGFETHRWNPDTCEINENFTTNYRGINLQTFFMLKSLK